MQSTAPVDAFLPVARVLTIAALRRLHSRIVEPAETDSSQKFMNRHFDAVVHASKFAIRRAFASLEIAAGEPSLVERVVAVAAPERREIVTNQIATLRADFGIAEILSEANGQAIQLSRFLATPRRAEWNPKAFVANFHPEKNEASPQETEASNLESVAEELKLSGRDVLARFLLASGKFGGFLALRLIDYYLCRAMRIDPAVGGDFVFVHLEPAEDLWQHDLSDLARLLESDFDKVVQAIADNSKITLKEEDSSAGASVLDKLFQQGFDSYMAADYERAIVHFSAALRMDPASLPLRAYRGDAYRLLCEYDRAIADYSSALRINPQSAPVLVQRATAQRLKGDAKSAVEDCSAAIALDPTHALAYLCRAEAHAALGNIDDAIADFGRTARLSPDAHWANFGRGKLYLQSRKHAAAIADFNQVLAINPYYAPALLLRADTNLDKGEIDAAIEDYTDFLRHHPRNQLAFRCRALAHEKKGDTSRALADYGAALYLVPEDAIALTRRGVLYRRSLDHKRALNDFNEAIRLAPKNVEVYCNRGLIFLAQGRFPDALADFNAALELDTNRIAAYLGRALVYDRMGQFLDGIQNCGRAMQLDEKSAATYLLRGILSSHAGKFDRAIFDLSKAIDLDPNFALTYQERGMVFMLSGEHAKAISDFSRLIELNPGAALAYVIRGTVRQLRGDNDAAVEDFGQALRLEPKSILTGWHQTLAERSRSQMTQVLVDYIDGAPPKRPATPFRKQRTLVKPVQPTNKPESEPVALEPKAVPSQPAAPVARTKKRSKAAETHAAPTETQSSLPVSAAKTMPSMTIAADLDSDVGEQLYLENVEGETVVQPQPKPTSDTVDIIEPTADEVQVVADVISEEDAAALLETAPTAEASTASAPPPPSVVPGRCPVCPEGEQKQECLPDGRVRCLKCQTVFLPQAAAPRPLAVALPKSTPKGAPAPKKKQDDDDDEPQVTLKQKVLLTVCVASLLLIVTYFFFPSFDGSGDGPPVAAKVTADTLFKEFSVNPKEAAKKYTTAPIVVSGEVADIMKDKRPRVRFKLQDKSKLTVEALFSHVNDMKDIEIGKTITVRGECDGWQKRVLEISLCKQVPN